MYEKGNLMTFKFSDLGPDEMKDFFLFYSYQTMNGDTMIPPSEEIERIVRENQSAAHDLNPAHRYMKVYSAGSWDFPRDKDGNVNKKAKETGDWKSIMDKRKSIAKRIVDSAPERMIGL